MKRRGASWYHFSCFLYLLSRAYPYWFLTPVSFGSWNLPLTLIIFILLFSRTRCQCNHSGFSKGFVIASASEAISRDRHAPTYVGAHDDDVLPTRERLRRYNDLLAAGSWENSLALPVLMAYSARWSSVPI